MKKLIAHSAAALALAGLALAPLSALAQEDQAASIVGAAASAAAAVNAGSSANKDDKNSVKAEISIRLGAKEEKGKANGAKEIDRRVQALTELLSRVGSMGQVSAQFKASLTSAVQNQIDAFTALKAKIAADTSTTTLKEDIKSITDSYRVFALIIPQGRIAAEADRIVNIATMLGGLGPKLQARISSVQSAGVDTTALSAALADLQTQISNASSQAQAAVSVSAALTLDQGDKTKMAANEAALKQARGNLETAEKALKAARKDVETILKGIRSAKINTKTEATTTSQR